IRACGTALYARRVADAFGEARTSARRRSSPAVASACPRKNYYRNRDWGYAERHSGCLRSASGQRLCGSAAHGLIVRGCATQRVALKRGAEAPGPRNGRASAATARWAALPFALVLSAQE